MFNWVASTTRKSSFVGFHVPEHQRSTGGIPLSMNINRWARGTFLCPNYFVDPQNTRQETPILQRTSSLHRLSIVRVLPSIGSPSLRRRLSNVSPCTTNLLFLESGADELQMHFPVLRGNPMFASLLWTTSLIMSRICLAVLATKRTSSTKHRCVMLSVPN